MGYWFGKFDTNKKWRKTPVKINGKWFTPTGEGIHDPKAYFRAVRRNGRYWEGDTGWD